MMTVVFLGIVYTSGVRVNKSPLATWDPSSVDVFNLATVGSGTLDISSGCVRLILENQKSVLLVWPEPTSWNTSSQAIEFVGVQGERAELRDGDRIIPSGSSAVYVRTGDWITKGMIIGKIGNTGNTVGPTGNHLHFEVVEDGRYGTPRNPREYIHFFDGKDLPHWV